MDTRTRSTRSTAHVGYLPDAIYTWGGPVIRTKYHAIADQAVRAAGVPAGEPLCGAVGLVLDPDFGLFPPPVNCPVCLRIVTAAGVQLVEAATSAD